jgi:hypothetical protein
MRREFVGFGLLKPGTLRHNPDQFNLPKAAARTQAVERA